MTLLRHRQLPIKVTRCYLDRGGAVFRLEKSSRSPVVSASRYHLEAVILLQTATRVRAVGKATRCKSFRYKKLWRSNLVATLSVLSRCAGPDLSAARERIDGILLPRPTTFPVGLELTPEEVAVLNGRQRLGNTT